jgi:hypothetical protein
MDKNERKLLEDAYGSEWYKKWGFTKKDLKEIENTPTLSSDSS